MKTELCNTCGLQKEMHANEDGMFLCVSDDGVVDRNNEFSPSGLCAAPVEFVEAVRAIVENEYRLFYCDSMDQNTELSEKLRSLLSAIDGKEKNDDVPNVP